MDSWLNQILYRWTLRKHPCPTPILLPTDKYSYKRRLEGIRKVVDLYDNKLDHIYRPMMRALKEKYEPASRCFIIGNGPSLRRVDLSTLADEVTFAVNGIFLQFFATSFRPTFYVVEDHLVAEDRAAEINALGDSIKLFPMYLGYCLDEGPGTLFFNHVPRVSYPTGFDFSVQADMQTYTGGTVTFTCLQLAAYMGFEQIYLLGIDHSYAIPKSVQRQTRYGVDILDMEDSDPNHFSPDYFGKGMRWHDPRVDVMEAAYREAHRVCSRSGISIFNATVGGRLEIFPRVTLESVIGPDQVYPGVNRARPTVVNAPLCQRRDGQWRRTTSPQSGTSGRSRDRKDGLGCNWPRVLVVSSTLMNSDSATGSLLRSLFDGWPKSGLAQVHTDSSEVERDQCDKHFRLSRKGYNLSALLESVKAYNPQIIYYRIVGEPPMLTRFVNRYIDLYPTPLVTHIMDDWPEFLRQHDPVVYNRAIAETCLAFTRADRNLAISDVMCDAFRQRFGVDFEVVRNGVEIADPAHQVSPYRPDRPFTIRYMGSLAENMQLDSVLEFAQAVHRLQDGREIVFEVFVHERFSRNTRAFRGLKGVLIHNFVPSGEYREMLRSADALLIAANFDPRSLSYIRYSFANKIPEYMASGVPIFVYGPREAASIDYLLVHGVATGVTTRDAHHLCSGIKELVEDEAGRVALTERALREVSRHHRLEDIREQFHSMLEDVAGIARREVKQDGSLVGEYTRKEKKHVDESGVLAEVMLKRKDTGIMIDVGAHVGSAISPFAATGWKVYAFEPDARNRQSLVNRFGGEPHFHIDARAVGNAEEHDIPFFRSNESSGISTLTPFHPSHKQRGHVDVTTLEAIRKEYGIAQIDYLLVDAEGYDLFVLQGLDWDRCVPQVVMCEFEDRKTEQLGYTFRDLAEFLTGKGYRLLVSEWHSIMKYGIRHSWRRLSKYPCQLRDEEAWGNLLAFTREEDLERTMAGIGRMATPAVGPDGLVLRAARYPMKKLRRLIGKLYW